MPRNRFGGKHAKKMGNKHVNAQETESLTLSLPEEDDQYFAMVLQKLGDGRFTVEYMKDGNKTEGMAKIPGSMKKTIRNIKDGTIVVFQSWGLSENCNKGSILHVYSEYETTILLDRGCLKGLIEEEPEDKAIPTEPLENNSNAEDTLDIDIDTI